MSARFDRRRFIVGAAAGGAALVLPLRLAGPRTPTAAAAPFTRPLPIPQLLTGAELTIPIREADVQVLDGAPTRMWTYGGTFPGPTIRRPAGQRTAITFVHDLPAAGHLTVHRHGGHNRSSEDGQPGGMTPDHQEMVCDLSPREEKFGTDLLIAPGGSRRYVYDLVEDGGPERAAFEWYHDHRCDRTAINVWNGLAGMFIVEDDFERSLGLPADEFDVPLMVVDRSFLDDNQLSYRAFRPGGGPLAQATPQPGLPPSDEVVGDRILVNGAVQPYFEVAARRYRLRLLNAANFSSYNFALSTGEDLVQIATESGLLPAPISRKGVLLGPAERAEVVVDFSGKLGQTLTLMSLPSEEGGQTAASGAPPQAELMQFRVTRPAVDGSRVPGQLRPLPEWVRELSPAPDRTWVFELDYDKNKARPAWGINGLQFDPDRVDAYPRLGTTETWQLVNVSNVTHLIHLHAADWYTLSRNGEPPPAWEDGLKETWRLEPGESVVVGAKFSDYAGRYVMHCHMLEHEDHGMMATFEVLGEDAPSPEDAGGGGGVRREARRRSRASTLGLPSPRACRAGRIPFRLRVPKGTRIRRAFVYVDGKRVRTLRGRSLRRLHRIKLGPGRARVTVVVHTRGGKRLAATRQYTCPRPARRPRRRTS